MSDDEQADIPWTREQFEAKYNGGEWRYGLERGRLSIRCHENELGADYDHACHGWKMTSLEWLNDEIELWGASQAEVDEALAHRLELLAMPVSK